MNSIRRLWGFLQLLRRAGGVKGARDIARNLPRYLQLCRRLIADKRVPASAKAVLLGAGAFAVSPLNLPALIPFVGVLDDIGIALLAWDYFLKQVPPEVLAEHRVEVGLPPDTDSL